MADQEEIVIQIDDTAALRAIDRANAGVKSAEGNVTHFYDQVGRAFEVHGDVVVRVADKSKNSVDRLVASMQKQAALYGLSGVEKLVAEKDVVASRWEREPRAKEAILESYDIRIAKQRQLDTMADREIVSEEKLIALLERKAALYGRSGSDRLIAERDLTLGQYGAAAPGVPTVNTRGQQAIYDSYSKMLEQEQRNATTGGAQSMEQMNAALEKRAALYNKTGIARIDAEEQLLLKTYEKEPAAIQNITKQFAAMRQAEQEAMGAKAKQEADNYINSLERRAALAGKTGAARVGTERELAMKQYAGQPELLAKIATHFNAIEVAEEGATKGSRRLFLAMKDLYEGRAAYAQVEVANYLGGLSGGAMVAGVAVAGTAALGLAGYKSMKDLGDYAREMENIHEQTGIATENLEQFRYAAERTGQSVEIFTRMMRGLSGAASEQSIQGDKARKALKDLGEASGKGPITLFDNYGQLRPTEEVLLDISRAIEKLPPGFKASQEMIEIFKRSGIETIPVLRGLAQSVDEMNAKGFRYTAEDKKQWDEYESRLKSAGEAWTYYKHQAEGAIASVAMDIESQSEKLVGLLQILGAVRNYRRDQSNKDSDQGLPVEGGEKAQLQAMLDRMSRARHETDSRIQSDLDRYEKEDPQWKLHRDEKALTALGNPPVAHVSTDAQRQEYSDAKALVDADKAAIKAAEQAKEIAKAEEAFKQRMTEVDENPILKIYGERDALVKKGGNWSQTTESANIGAQSSFLKQQEESDKKLGDTFRRFIETSNKIEDEQEKQNEKRLNEFSANWLRGMQGRLHQLQVIDDQNAQRMEDAEKHQERMLSLAADPNQQLSVLRQQQDARDKIRETELQIATIHKGIYDLDDLKFKNERASQDERYAMEEKILEIKKQQNTEIEHSVQPLIHSLLTNPSKFPQQLGTVLRDATLKPIEEGLSKMVAGALQPIIFGRDTQGGIAGGMKSLFVPKQDKQELLASSTDVNSRMTEANSEAIRNMTAVIEGNREAYKAASTVNASQYLPPSDKTAATYPELVKTTIPNPATGGKIEVLSQVGTTQDQRPNDITKIVKDVAAEPVNLPLETSKHTLGLNLPSSLETPMYRGGGLSLQNTVADMKSFVTKPDAYSRITHTPIYTYSAPNSAEGGSYYKGQILLNTATHDGAELLPQDHAITMSNILRHEQTHALVEPFLPAIAKDPSLQKYIPQIRTGLVQEYGNLYKPMGGDLPATNTLSEGMAYMAESGRVPGLDPNESRAFMLKSLRDMDAPSVEKYNILSNGLVPEKKTISTHGTPWHSNQEYLTSPMFDAAQTASDKPLVSDTVFAKGEVPLDWGAAPTSVGITPQTNAYSDSVDMTGRPLISDTVFAHGEVPIDWGSGNGLDPTTIPFTENPSMESTGSGPKHESAFGSFMGGLGHMALNMAESFAGGGGSNSNGKVTDRTTGYNTSGGALGTVMPGDRGANLGAPTWDSTTNQEVYSDGTRGATGWTPAVQGGGGAFGSMMGSIGLGSNTARDSSGELWSSQTNPFTGQQTSYDMGSGLGGTATAIATSKAAGAAGGMLFNAGAFGERRGTWGGTAETTAGAALMGGSIGMMVGGPAGALAGAAIGAAVGFTVGGVEQLLDIQSDEVKAKKQIKALYGVSIDENMAHQISGIAKSKFADNVAMTIRDPEVRKMILLYSEATGQKMPQSATTPRAASLVEAGGKLSQAATYQDGQGYTYQSSLPVAGGYSTASSAPGSVILNINGESAADLLEGRVASTVTPSFVQDQYASAAMSSYGRTSNSAATLQPGLAVS